MNFTNTFNLDMNKNASIEDKSVNSFFASKDFLTLSIVKTLVYILIGIIGMIFSAMLVNFLVKNMDDIIYILTELGFEQSPSDPSDNSGSFSISGDAGSVASLILIWCLFGFAKKEKSTKQLFVVIRVLLGFAIAGLIIGLIGSAFLPFLLIVLPQITDLNNYIIPIAILIFGFIGLVIVQLINTITKFKLLKPFAQDDSDVIDKIPSLKKLKVLYYIQIALSIILPIILCLCGNSYLIDVSLRLGLSSQMVYCIAGSLIRQLSPFILIITILSIVPVISDIFTVVTIKKFEIYLYNKKASRKVNILDY